VKLVKGAERRSWKVPRMQTLYGLNWEERIILISGDWDSFALSNQGSAAVARLVLYRPLWDFIGGLETRQFLQQLFGTCRERRATFSTLSRCDDSASRRLLRMTVTPGEHGMLFVEHALVQENQMTRNASVNLDEVTWVAQCSICCALRFGDNWVASRLRPSGDDFPKAHAICPDCRAGIRFSSAGQAPGPHHAALLDGFPDTGQVVPMRRKRDRLD
jgi:hypothetical protein